MRKCGITRDAVIVIFHQIQATKSLIYEEAHRCDVCCKAQNNTIVGGREQNISSLRSGLNRTRGWSIKTAENIAESASDVKTSQWDILRVAEGTVYLVFMVSEAFRVEPYEPCLRLSVHMRSGAWFLRSEWGHGQQLSLTWLSRELGRVVS
jgi:hypothetical protein